MSNDVRRVRPGQETDPQKFAATTSAAIVPTIVRCRRCRHPLTAPASVVRGLGPVCRHLTESLAVVA